MTTDHGSGRQQAAAGLQRGRESSALRRRAWGRGRGGPRHCPSTTLVLRGWLLVVDDGLRNYGARDPPAPPPGTQRRHSNSFFYLPLTAGAAGPPSSPGAFPTSEAAALLGTLSSRLPLQVAAVLVVIAVASSSSFAEPESVLAASEAIRRGALSSRIGACW